MPIATYSTIITNAPGTVLYSMPNGPKKKVSTSDKTTLLRFPIKKGGLLAVFFNNTMQKTVRMPLPKRIVSAQSSSLKIFILINCAIVAFPMPRAFIRSRNGLSILKTDIWISSSSVG